jgi:hypothetical protein
MRYKNISSFTWGGRFFAGPEIIPVEPDLGNTSEGRTLTPYVIVPVPAKKPPPFAGGGFFFVHPRQVRTKPVLATPGNDT